MLSWLTANPLFLLTCRLQFRNQLSSFAGHRNGLELSQSPCNPALAKSGRARVVTKRVVNGEGTGVEGVDITIPVYNFSETHYLPTLIVTPQYKADLFRLTGRTNQAPFRGFQPGEVLFLGASGSLRIGFNLKYLILSPLFGAFWVYKIWFRSSFNSSSTGSVSIQSALVYGMSTSTRVLLLTRSRNCRPTVTEHTCAVNPYLPALGISTV